MKVQTASFLWSFYLSFSLVCFSLCMLKVLFYGVMELSSVPLILHDALRIMPVHLGGVKTYLFFLCKVLVMKKVFSPSCYIFFNFKRFLSYYLQENRVFCALLTISPSLLLRYASCLFPILLCGPSIRMKCAWLHLAYILMIVYSML